MDEAQFDHVFGHLSDHVQEKLRLRKNVLNNYTGLRGEKRWIWYALNIGSILVIGLIANECYQNLYYFLSFLPMALDFFLCLCLRLCHCHCHRLCHRFHYSLVPLISWSHLQESRIHLSDPWPSGASSLLCQMSYFYEDRWLLNRHSG